MVYTHLIQYQTTLKSCNLLRFSSWGSIEKKLQPFISLKSPPPPCFLEVAGVQQMAYGAPDLSRRRCWRPHSGSSLPPLEMSLSSLVSFKFLSNFCTISSKSLVEAFISYSHSGSEVSEHHVVLTHILCGYSTPVLFFFLFFFHSLSGFGSRCLLLNFQHHPRLHAVTLCWISYII